jgi:chaperone LolA
VLLAGIALVPVPAAAALPDPARLLEFLEQTHALRADFTQVVRDGNGKTIQEGQGTMVIERPQRFRWDYRNPSPQLVISNGKTLWIYDEDLEQVTVKTVDAALANTPAMLLGSDPKVVERDYVTTALGGRDGLEWFELKPRQEGRDFDRIRIGFGAKLPERMELVDNLGQTTTLSFTALEQNPRVDPKAFEFTPPPGIDVIGEAR